MTWAIINTRTNKWVYGTDYRMWPHRQKTSYDKAILFDEEMDALHQFKHRQCGKDYKVVEVELKEVQE